MQIPTPNVVAGTPLSRGDAYLLDWLVNNQQDYAILMMDLSGVICWMNQAAYRAFGAADALIGQPFSILFPVADRQAHIPEQEMEQALHTGRIEGARTLVRPNGTTFWVTGILGVLRNAQDVPVGFVKFLRDSSEMHAANTERQALLERESAARAQAEEVLRAQEAFLSTAAHELKNPLTAIIGNVQLLQHRLKPGSVIGERELRQLQSVSEQVDRLRRLMINLLDSAQMEQPELTTVFAPVNLGALVAKVVSEISPTLATHEIQCEVAEPVVISGDEMRLAQVLHNLIGNAVKYSSPVSTVMVSVTRDGACGCVAVEDHGIGIPEAALPKLFTRFYRAKQPGAAVSGMGIGLYVVKQIIEQHGGNVSVASQEGVGSTFRFCVPLREQ